MHALCVRSAGRSGPTVLSFSRHNSSNVPRPRIAKSWGDIVIPSAEEISQKIAKGNAYKPDLSYLRSGKQSLASKLAQGASATPVSVLAAALPKQQPVESRQERTLRVNAITAARKEARETRERSQREAKQTRERLQNETRKVVQAALEAKRATQAADNRASAEKARLLTDKRKAQRLHREASLTPSQRLEVDQHLLEAPRARTLRTSRQSSRKPSLTKQRPGSTRAMAPRKPNFRIQAMPSQDDNQLHSKDDISLEIIEAGGDAKEPPEFMTPDILHTHLDLLFEASTTHPVGSKTTSLTSRQNRQLRQSYAGDYANSALKSVTPTAKLSPIKHAEVILARRSDVSVQARDKALAIVASAVGVNAGTQTVKATVN
ncbi:hypothetical protein H0H93_004927 [Arthromyces matolae]|nr:hypothetical protein H0H93_004927 [Arthromyces matolae]